MFNPGLNDVGFPSGVVPDGNNLLYMTSPGHIPITQVLTGFMLTANTVYTLTVAVGNPADRPDSLSFAFDNVRLTETPSAPEPGTYTMMLTGLGLIGCATRRSKRR